ncbi:MAG: hypothetical protein KatS3mg050_4362 [Litorilinea sp.]|nr:MAG: hypothetical protein KatS3mg050_4362 [Litorilinea sp.]
MLHGESPARIAFLRRLLEEHAPEGLDPVSREGASKGEDYYLFYFGVAQPGRFLFTLPEAHQYRLDVIDTWNMTITPRRGDVQRDLHAGAPQQTLPCRSGPSGRWLSPTVHAGLD